MKTERQQDQDVAERLRRENLERVEAGGCAPPVMVAAPKDNEVDETPHWGELMRELRSEVPEALATLVDRLSFACDQRLSFLLHERYEQNLSHAATVAELRERIVGLENAMEWVKAREEYLRGQVQRVIAVTEEFEGMTGAGYRYMAANIRAALTGADPT